MLNSILVIAFWVLTVLTLGLATLWGLGRGLNRAALRLVLVIICAILAFALRGVVANTVLGIEVDAAMFIEGAEEGEMITLQDGLVTMITSMLGEGGMESLGETVAELAVDMVKVISYPFIFMILFVVLRFFSWIIVFPICKAILKRFEKKYNGEQAQTSEVAADDPSMAALADGTQPIEQPATVMADSTVQPAGPVAEEAPAEPKQKAPRKPFNLAKKRKGFGALVGLAHGVVIAICLIMPIACLVYQGGAAMAAMSGLPTGGDDEFVYLGQSVAYADDYSDGSDYDSDSGFGEFDVNAMFEKFNNSVIGKFYGKLCKSSFDSIASVRRSDGTRMTLLSFVDLAQSAMQMMESMEKMQGVFEDMEGADMGAMINALKDLDKVMADMSPEAKATLNSVVKDVVGAVVKDMSSQADDPMMGAVLKALDKTLQDTDFTSISFEKEGQAIADIVEAVESMSSEGLNAEKVGGLLQSVGESQLIVSMVENIELEDIMGEEANEMLDEDTKKVIEDQLDQFATTNEQKRAAEALKSLLGISGNAD